MLKFLENVIDVMGFLDKFKKTKDTSTDSENRSSSKKR